MMVNVFFSLTHFWPLLLYISRSSAASPTLHCQGHHNLTTSFSQYVWSSSVSLALYFPSSINFFNGWFRLHVRNNLFCLFNKVPDLTTAMDWFAVCSAHELKIFPDIIYFQMHLCVSPCFCSGSTWFTSMWQLKICTFIMRCLILLFVAFHSYPCL